ncbi:hypothetical protein PVAND_012820 [Polypedilum vanderplanki]|uniref:H15 domain-containing protein n=1 Tax=Polypedilum vanderplanki TaxID=319348 RepID=A0A9J6CMM5_POLVA|nr:hypothetical protein PVAND_012820 [Polypedilum vanderplanki]
MATENAIKKLVIKKKHPSVKQMVFTAMREIDEKNSGVGFKKIEKYLFKNYSVNEKKIVPHIKIFLRKALESELLKLKRGHGLSGTFKRNLKKINEDAKNNAKKPVADLRKSEYVEQKVTSANSKKPENVEKKTTSAKSKKTDNTPKKTDNTPKKTAKKNVAKSTKALSKTTSKKSAAAATAKSKKTVEIKESKSVKK